MLIQKDRNRLLNIYSKIITSIIICTTNRFIVAVWDFIYFITSCHGRQRIIEFPKFMGTMCKWALIAEIARICSLK